MQQQQVAPTAANLVGLPPNNTLMNEYLLASGLTQNPYLWLVDTCWGPIAPGAHDGEAKMKVLFRLYRRSQELVKPACDMMKIISHGFNYHSWLAQTQIPGHLTARGRAAAAIVRDQCLICMQLQIKRLITIRNTIRAVRRLIDNLTWPHMDEFCSLACKNPVHGSILLPTFIY